jgi:predicted adenine nucleotide alpha hydrolase (AANH) superfamily ATPase
MKQKLLLHSCCAPCSIYVLDQLAQDYELSIFFYDPNIHPRREYIQRRDEMKGYAQKIGIKFEEGEYNTAHWFDKTKGLENEPEKGKRCGICFDIRLGKTAKRASQENYDLWSTVMSISPHKDVSQINCVANKLADKYNIKFLEADWKKNEGFKIASQMSKAENFYRQDYCGCVYSKIARAKQIKARNEN